MAEVGELNGDSDEFAPVCGRYVWRCDSLIVDVATTLARAPIFVSFGAICTTFASEAKGLKCTDLHDAGRMEDVTIVVSADVVPNRPHGYERCVFFRL